MKTKNLMGILLTVSGIGLVGYLVWRFTQPSSQVKTSPTANPGTASPFSSLYNGFGKLFGGKNQTDNTGQLITASGNAFTSIFNSAKSIWGTPVSSPAAPNTTAFDPTNPGSNFFNSLPAPLTDSQIMEGVNLEAPAQNYTGFFNGIDYSQS
jgi:hypothetical protein